MQTTTAQFNPTGANGMGGISPSWGPDMPTGGPGNYNFGNSMNPNPTGPGGPSTAPTMTPGSQPFNPGTSTPYDANFASKLRDTFGSGMGDFLFSFLTKDQGGFNSDITKQSVDAQIEGMQHDIQRGWGNVSSSLGGAGISPNSSVYALAAGDYFSNATTQENALLANEYYNMWNASEGREYGLLGETSAATAAHQGKAGDWINQVSAIGGLFQGSGFQSSDGSGASSAFML